MQSPTKRFSNRVENYVKYRPGYPAAIIPFLENELGITKDARIADIGSGTGLFAEPLLQQGYSIICIEPNEEMARAGEERLKKFPGFTSRLHSAEATGLRSHSLDLITVAQAFHWFDVEGTRKEFHRILKPEGHIVLAWNIRQTNTDFLRLYEALKEKYRLEATPDKIDFSKVDPFFAPSGYKKTVFPNVQSLDFESLKGQLLSSSYIPLPGHENYDTMIAELVQLFVKYNENGFVKMEYETILYYN
jgi:ubiquinone/menaquinone biosynthesis C-methylase UbiE